MSEISEQGGSKGKQRAKKQSTKIDMTPMVDLAFLLLTFFILTTTLAEQKAFDITLPVPSKDTLVEPDKVNNAVTLILTDKDKVIYYDDEFKGVDTKMYKVDYKELVRHLAERNAPTIKKINAMTKDFDKKYKENVKKLGGDQNAKDSLEKLLKANRSHIWKGEGDKTKQGVFAIIKYDDKARYRNVVDIVDEMSLLGIEGYAIVKDLTGPEKQIIKLTFGNN